MQIKHLDRASVDDLRWNKCIDKSINGIVYAYTWYLDIVAPNWCCLVADDYSYVFPLPVNRRFGINALMQPLFTQQLGLFSPNHITPEILKAFLQGIPAKYRYINIHFNTLNLASANYYGKRVTHHLDLIQPYALIQKGFNQNTRRNILRAHAFEVEVLRNVKLSDFISFYKENGAVKFSGTKYNMVEHIINALLSRGLGCFVGAYFRGNLCAVAFIVKSNGKLIYLFACSSPIGLANRAMFAVVDRIICWNAESHLVLDFEGSMIPSVARFYLGFGAKPCSYIEYKVDNSPIAARLMFKLRAAVAKYLR